MRKFSPKVSIIIPVYNGSDFLKYAIDSSLNQSYQNIEVIVVNDGSADQGKTESIALSYGNKISYYKKKNGGVSSALNFGIKHMKGDYFSWLSHDDIYMANKIESQVNYLKNISKKKIILYSNFLTFSELSNKEKVYKLGIKKPDNFRYEITKTSFLNGCSLLIPAEAFRDYGLFDEKLKHTQDYDMWFRLAKTYSFHNVCEVLVRSRIHPNQDSILKIEDAHVEVEKMLINFIKLLQKDSSGTRSGIFFKEVIHLCFYCNLRGYKDAANFAKNILISLFQGKSYLKLTIIKLIALIVELIANFLANIRMLIYYSRSE